MLYLLASRLAARRLLVLEANKALPLFGIGNRLKSARSAGVKPPPNVQHSVPRPNETHDDKSRRLGRPLSPHITIYRPEIGSFTSIWHRITGTGLSLYVLGFATCAFVNPYDYCQVIEWIDCMELPVFVIWGFRYCFAFPLIYHTLFGIRHIVWDFTAKFMTRDMLKQSSLINLGLTTVLTLIAIFIPEI